MKGWKSVTTMGKAHYFDIPEGQAGGKSLCGVIPWTTALGLFDTMHDHELNCKICMKIRNKNVKDAGR